MTAIEDLNRVSFHEGYCESRVMVEGLTYPGYGEDRLPETSGRLIDIKSCFELAK